MKKQWKIALLCLLSAALMLSVLKVPFFVEEEQELITEQEELQFRQPIAHDGGYHCNCGGVLRQVGEARLHRAIQRDSPNQQGVRWIYSFRYCCDLCQWDRIYVHTSAMPAE